MMMNYMMNYMVNIQNITMVNKNIKNIITQMII